MNKTEALENAWNAYCNRLNAIEIGNAKLNEETSKALTEALCFVNKMGWIPEWNVFCQAKNKEMGWW